ARHFGLAPILGERTESQDLCFVNPGEHWKLTEVYRPDLPRDGRFLSVSGEVLGRHRGIHRYTIGQRRGLGVAAPNPLYVAEIDADSGDIVLAERQHLAASAMLVKNVNWIGGHAPAKPFAAATKIRYRQDGAPSRVVPRNNHAALVQFETPQFAVTPGQVAAFYQDDELVGGGWIESAQTL
ncbi:MAG: aminomethyltransferase beta-barrel domain-containing protein, partial [Verrucomicrobiota bacterium]